MKWMIGILIAVMSVMCAAQSMPVVPLSSADVAQVEATHQAMIEAEQAWEKLQKTIKEKYLIVDKDSPDASETKWYEDSLLILSAGSTLTYAPEYDTCDPQAKKEREKYAAEREKARTEREGKARRIRKGWVAVENCIGCGPKNFEYSSDWKYLVPAPELPKPQSLPGLYLTPSNGLTWPMGTAQLNISDNLAIDPRSGDGNGGGVSWTSK